MLRQFIRGFFKTYGYRFVATEELRGSVGRAYASLSIVDDHDGERKMLFMYLADEVNRAHVLSRENVESIVESCRTLLDHPAWNDSSAGRLNSSL